MFGTGFPFEMACEMVLERGLLKNGFVVGFMVGFFGDLVVGFTILFGICRFGCFYSW